MNSLIVPLLIAALTLVQYWLDVLLQQCSLC